MARRPPTPSPAALARLAAMLRLASEQTRLAMLLLLAEGERPVVELAGALGCAQTTLARHMALLRVARLVEARRVHTRVFYPLTDAGRGIVRVVEALVG